MHEIRVENSMFQALFFSKKFHCVKVVDKSISLDVLRFNVVLLLSVCYGSLKGLDPRLFGKKFENHSKNQDLTRKSMPKYA